MDFQKIYDIANGSVTMILTRLEKFQEKASLEVLTSADYNGTTGEIQFVQSNDKDIPLDKWHPLPEDPLVLDDNDSNLLSTFSFTAKFLALKFTVGDGTTGTLTLTANFKN